MRGDELAVGDRVNVYQEEGMREATIVAFTDSPTSHQEGFWVDVDFGEGPEGIPSYILRKIK